jgi:hypothetical protein
VGVDTAAAKLSWQQGTTGYDPFAFAREANTAERVIAQQLREL